MPFCGTFQKLRPLSLLTHLSSCYDSAHLRIFSNSVSWSIYLDRGKLLYALHSVEPFERLERHLHRLMPQIPELDSETWMQLRHVFKAAAESQSTFSKEESPPESKSTSSILPPDYQAICWLVSQNFMNLDQAATLVEELATEVIESLLLVQSGTYALEAQRNTELPVFCRLELQPLVESCQQRLQSGQSLGPQKTVNSDTFTQPQQLVQNIVLPSSKTAADHTATSPDGIAVAHKLPQQFAPLHSGEVPFTAQLPPKSEVFQTLAPTSISSRRESSRFPTRLLLIGIGIALGFTAFISRLYPDMRLNEIRTLKTEGRYKECITTAATAVQNPVISKKAQELLNACLMTHAEHLAATGKLKEAIATARKIPANSPLYPHAQKRLREWDEI